MLNRLRILIALGHLLACSLLQAEWVCHVTKKAETIQTYHGIQLKDEYQYLEDFQSAESKAWYQAQNQLTQSVLEQIPGRDYLLERIQQLDSAKPTKVYSFDRAGDRYFYLVEKLGAEVGSLHFRDGIEGESQLIIDPKDFAQEGEALSAIDDYSVSPDGTKVSFSIATGGSDVGILRVYDIESGKLLEESIPRVKSAGSWHKDGSGLFYNQIRIPEPDEPRGDYFKRSRAKFHRLGASVEDDPILVSFHHSPELEIAELDYPYVFTMHGCDYLFCVISHGVDKARTVFVSPLSEGVRPDLSWRKIYDREDKISSFDNIGNDLFLLSFKGAPYFRVLHGSLDRWDLANLQEVVPESDTVLSSLQTTANRLYVQGMKGGMDELLEVGVLKPGYPSRNLQLPVKGSVYQLPADPTRDDVFLALNSWNQATAYYRYTPDSGEIVQTAIRPLGEFDVAPWVEVKEVLVPSHDGTEVPLSILSKKGLELDGKRPTLLYGYGAYGNSRKASHSVIRLAWLEQGGVYAVAKVRGGGEFGDRWHRAGWKATKFNTWKDFNACAKFLIEEGYTSKGQIGGMGGSAGGILISRAMISEPDLWGAMVNLVGVCNPVRNHVRANGAANAVEYGDPLDPEEFPYVLAMDGYHNIRPDTHYPAVLFTAGYNDSRVPPWQPGKMAARLQALPDQSEPFLMRVEFGGGHQGFARSMIHKEYADIYAFLFWQLVHPDYLMKEVLVP